MAKSLFNQFAQIRGSRTYDDTLGLSWSEATGRVKTASLIVDVSGTTITRNAGTFEQRDLGNYITISGSAYEITASTGTASVTVASAPGDSTGTSAALHYFQNLEADLNYIRSQLKLAIDRDNWYDTPRDIAVSMAVPGDDDTLLTEKAIYDFISTVSGVGPTNHSELNELDYVNSGHTGFASSADLATTSGDIDTHINDNSIHYTWATVSATIDHNTIINTHNLTTDIDHDQLTNFETDEHFTEASIDKYTTAEVDNLITTASGDIIDQIPVNHSDLIDDEATKHRLINDSGTSSTELWSANKISSEIITISGKLDDHNEMNNLDYASAGHTGFVSSTDLTTASGDIVSQMITDHTALSNIGTNSHSDIDTHIDDSTKHYTWATVSATIDHDTIINTHNLTTDIDHDQLTNYSADEHFTEASIYHSNILNLDYASAGHTGFAPTSHAHDKIEEGNSLVEVTDSGTGQVDITVDSNLISRFDSGGFTLSNGILKARINEDITHELGRAKIGYNGTDADMANFAHYDYMTSTNYALKQNSSGVTSLNSVTGSSLYLNINASPIATISAVGLTVEAGVLSARADTDTTHELGRLKLGYRGDAPAADYGIIAHYDHMDSTNYAFAQGSAADTILNGSTLQFNIGNVAKFDINASGLIGNAGARISQFDDDNTLAANSATRGITQAAVKGYVNTVSGVLQDSIDAQDEFIELTDTPAAYTSSEDQFTLSTGSGIEFSGTGLTYDGNKLIVDKDTGGTYDSTTVALIAGDSDSGDSVYIIGNTIGAGYNSPDGSNALWINYRGHNAGTSNFRDFTIGTGKGVQMANFDGSTGKFIIGATTVPSTYLHIQQNLAGEVSGYAENINTTNGAYASWKIETADSGVGQFAIANPGNGNADIANRVSVFANSACYGASLTADSATGDIRFYTGGRANERARITSSGTMQLFGDLLVDGGNIGITTDPDLMQLASGTLTVNSVIKAGADQDVTHELGKAKIGYNGINTDMMVLAHYDHMGGYTFAIRQNSTGDTELNAPTGRTVSLNNNGFPIFDVTADGLIGNAGARISQFDDDTSLAENSATRGVTQQAVKGYVVSQIPTSHIHYDEDLTWVGSNDEWTLTDATISGAVPDNLQVFLNGLKNRDHVDYYTATASGTTLTVAFAYTTYDTDWANATYTVDI